MKRIFLFALFAFFSINFASSQEAINNEENTEVSISAEEPEQEREKDFIIHYKRWIFDSIDTFQLSSQAENPPKVPLRNKELYKMLLTVDENEKLVKKAKFWKGVGYVTLGAFIGTGIGYYFSERGSDAELYAGVACFCSLLSIPIVNNISVSYKLQAIDNYNLSLEQH